MVAASTTDSVMAYPHIMAESIGVMELHQSSAPPRYHPGPYRYRLSIQYLPYRKNENPLDPATHTHTLSFLADGKSVSPQLPRLPIISPESNDATQPIISAVHLTMRRSHFADAELASALDYHLNLVQYPSLQTADLDLSATNVAAETLKYLHQWVQAAMRRGVRSVSLNLADTHLDVDSVKVLMDGLSNPDGPAADGLCSPPMALRLNLSHNTEIGDEGLKYVLDHFPFGRMVLEKLDVLNIGLSPASAATVRYLQKMCGGMDVRYNCLTDASVEEIEESHAQYVWYVGSSDPAKFAVV